MADWTTKLPPEPHLGDDLPQPELSVDMLARLALRRSHTAVQMGEPGPKPAERDALLRIAARVPDHRRVHPFRFVTFEGEARAAFGDILSAAFIKANPDTDENAAHLERERLTRAPLVVAVISTPDREHKTPEWEQILTAGAAAQNLLIAAGAAGYAAQWLTEWYSYDETVIAGLGLLPHEKVVGFVYIGTATEVAKERARLDAEALTSSWEAPAQRGS
jgi:nitroreductase